MSPLIALAWISGFGAFAGAAQADAPHGPGSTRAFDRPDQAAGAPATSSTTDAATEARSALTASARVGSAAHPDAHGGTSGVVTAPQPISHADANTGGANGLCPDGPYCSTRDGSASGNGNGGGQAVGKPCAGCVGRADNKNPRGQMPDASDHNAGYECDTNHGIARSNPAHTGCVTVPEHGCTPTPTVPCVPTESARCVPTPPCVPSSDTVSCVPSLLTTGGESSVVVSAPAIGATPAAAPPARSTAGPVAGVLPNTGAPTGLVALALAGLAALIGGAAVIGRRGRFEGRSTG